MGKQYSTKWHNRREMNMLSYAKHTDSLDLSKVQKSIGPVTQRKQSVIA